MIRFLRQNAEIITTICVVLSVLIGGTFLYMSRQAQQAGQAELDAILSEAPKAAGAVRPAVTAPVVTPTPASAPAVSARASASAVAETPQP